MGKDADPKVAYPMATAGGFLLAVCSCTVLPLFVGIWKRGAGLGPAITFLFVAPAINILALTYTGTLIGMDIALARGILAIVFAMAIGYIMALVFGNEMEPIDTQSDVSAMPVMQTDGANVGVSAIKMDVKIFIIAFAVFSLALATLDATMISFFGSLFSSIVAIKDLFQMPALIQTFIFLLGLVTLVYLTFKVPYKELTLFLWLIYILMTGTSQISYFNQSTTFYGIIISSALGNMIMKLLLVLLLVICLSIFVILKFDSEDITEWFRETWSFFKSIFPLIIIGVFIAGFIKYFVPPQVVSQLVGRNTVLANLIGVLFGVFMYFPTLMEVPIARIFLDLGMSRGPLLAYLLADPELSLQSILVTRKYLGDKKNLFYVVLVTVFTTLAGLIFGFVIGLGIGLW